MRKTAGHSWTDCNSNTDIKQELNVTPDLDKIQHYKRSWVRQWKRMPRKRLPRITKKKKIHPKAEGTSEDN